jgi:hypothetical protein
MKTKFIFLALLLSFSVVGQSFTAETGIIFIDGASQGEYYGGIKVLTGVLKKGDEIDVYAPTGRRFTFKITKLELDDNKDAAEARPKQFVMAVLFSKERADQGKDAINQGYVVYPKGFLPKNGAAINSAATEKPVFTAIINGKFYNSKLNSRGAFYYTKGVKGFVDEPFVQLAFASLDVVDNRYFLIQIKSPKEGTATYNSSQNIAVNFSGSIDGKSENAKVYGFDKNVAANTKFTIEITKWQRISDSKISISGRMNGDLPQNLAILGKKETLKLENGLFENIEVEVFTENYDAKQMINGGKN